MKRTTIFIPDTLEHQLQSFARANDKSVAAVVREALARHLELHREPIRLPATFDSGRRDVSERIDALMFDGVNPHGESRPVRKPRRRA